MLPPAESRHSPATATYSSSLICLITMESGMNARAEPQFNERVQHDIKSWLLRCI